MFTVADRAAASETVVSLLRADVRIVAGAAVGSLATDDGDEYSDIDLTFAVRDDAAVGNVLGDVTTTLERDLAAVVLVDLRRGPTTYRIFLLSDSLQLDLSLTPAAHFRPAGPRFRLLFGKTANGAAGTPTPSTVFIETAPVAEDLRGWGVVYALHARACIERGRMWQAEHYVGAVRDHALTLACLNRGLVAVQARAFDDLPADVLGELADSRARSLERQPLRESLAACARTLLRESAGLPHDAVVAGRLTDLC